MTNTLQVLGISGSLRQNSYNTAALRVALLGDWARRLQAGEKR